MIKQEESIRSIRFNGKDGSPESLVVAKERMAEFQKLEEPFIASDGKKYIRKWRIGKTTTQQIIIDVDSLDEFNIAFIRANLKEIFKDKFTTIKTRKGYQIIGENSYDKKEWEYWHMKLLDMNLDIKDAERFKDTLMTYLKRYRGSHKFSMLTFDEDFIRDIKLNPVGQIDYLYTLLCIERGKSTIRLTKKSDTDKWEMV